MHILGERGKERMSPCNELIPRSLRQLLQSRYLINPLLKRFSVGKTDGGGERGGTLERSRSRGLRKIIKRFPSPPLVLDPRLDDSGG